MTCTRCGGFALRTRDRFGSALSCMICGHEQHDTPPDLTPPPEGKGNHHARHLRPRSQARLDAAWRLRPRYAYARTYAERNR